MLKIPLFRELFEECGRELWSIVTHNMSWSTVASKMVFEFPDDGGTAGVWEVIVVAEVCFIFSGNVLRSSGQPWVMVCSRS